MSPSQVKLLQHIERMAGLFRSFRDFDILLEQALDSVIFLSGAERGFMFLCEERTGELRLVASRNPDHETVTDATEISRSILKGSLSQSCPTYSSNALRDSRFQNASSVVKFKIRSFICTPMWFEGKIIGTIYLDHRTERKTFKDSDAKILFALASFLCPVIINARFAGKLESRIEALQGQMGEHYRFENIVGRSRKFLKLFHLIEKVKDTNATILFLGESGTGKELLAKTLHQQSNRRIGPFVAVNCAAIPDSLIESELFGIVKGAATDVRERTGKFGEANGGTIFLDEVADLSLNAQAKVLRALQEKEIQQVGSNCRIPLDIRVISATNKNLETLLANGQFREDLYFRLNVIPIHLPPLRERREDIPLLMAHFTKQYSHALHKKTLKIPKETIRSYQEYSWPGNVRELRNVIEREVILAEDDTLPSLLQDGRIGEIYRKSLDRAMDQKFSEESLRREYTLRVFEQNGRNKRRTCDILGIDYKTLQKRLNKVTPPRKRDQTHLPFSR